MGQDGEVAAAAEQEIDHAGGDAQFLAEFGGCLAVGGQQAEQAEAAGTGQDTALGEAAEAGAGGDRGEQFDAGETAVEVVEDVGDDALVGPVQLGGGAQQERLLFGVGQAERAGQLV